MNTLGSGLSVFSNSNCANTSPSVNGPANATVSQGVIEQLIETHVTNPPETPVGLNAENPNNKAKEGNPNQVPAPGCNQQGPNSFNGQSSQFPHVAASGK